MYYYLLIAIISDDIYITLKHLKRECSYFIIHNHYYLLGPGTCILAEGTTSEALSIWNWQVNSPASFRSGRNFVKIAFFPCSWRLKLLFVSTPITCDSDWSGALWDHFTEDGVSVPMMLQVILKLESICLYWVSRKMSTTENVGLIK